MRHAVIVTAAGSSCRFNENSNQNQKKEFITIDGHSVLYRSVQPFTEVDGLCAIVITYQKDTLEETKHALQELDVKGVPVFFVEGGSTRQKSVFNALSFLNDNNSKLNVEYVSIHDGARPYITKELIGITLAAAVMYGAAAPAISVNDTLVRKTESGLISQRIERDGVCRIQTPQIFSFPDIYDAHVQALRDSHEGFTDDTAIFNNYGRNVYLVEGSEKNLKITFRKDI